jgi:UMF1 family MFS transporter
VSKDATMTNATTVRTKHQKRATFAWALWDWAEQPYPTIMQTFIFATYIVGSSFGDKAANTQALATIGIIAGIAVALMSPVIGLRSDEGGRRKFWLLVQSGVLVAIMAASFFVEPRPEFLWFGLILYGVGSVVQETAFINYYAMLKGVSSEKNMGRVSGMAWALAMWAASFCCCLHWLVSTLATPTGLVSPMTTQ